MSQKFKRIVAISEEVEDEFGVEEGRRIVLISKPNVGHIFAPSVPIPLNS